MDSIIFDVDGTLWDSTESVAQSWTAYLQEKEHMDITLTSARLMTLFGQTLSDIARQIFPDCSEAEQLRLIDGCCQAEHEALLKKCAPLYEDLEKCCRSCIRNVHSILSVTVRVAILKFFFRHQVLKNISKVIFVMEIPVWTKAPISVNLQTHMI